jgi:hypothetical protein
LLRALQKAITPVKEQLILENADCSVWSGSRQLAGRCGPWKERAMSGHGPTTPFKRIERTAGFHRPKRPFGPVGDD